LFDLPIDRPALMGILNVTPDSFSENGINFHEDAAVAAGLRMIEAGADLLDIGGESTRPGAEPVSIDEELRRVIPVIERLVVAGAKVSVDTRHAAVAARALEVGAHVVNDVSGLADPEMIYVCREGEAAVCIMHMQGAPQTMQANPTYEDVEKEVLSFLLDRAHFAMKAGIPAGQVWIDPGFGFGKTPAHNLQLLTGLSKFVASGFPVLIGVSRKSSIGLFAGGASVDRRLPGTLAAQVLAQSAGVRIVRAHDVWEARQAIDVAAAILKPSSFSKRPA
jgi:dihydropteroate synthase